MKTHVDDNLYSNLPSLNLLSLPPLPSFEEPEQFDTRAERVLIPRISFPRISSTSVKYNTKSHSDGGALPRTINNYVSPSVQSISPGFYKSEDVKQPEDNDDFRENSTGFSYFTGQRVIIL